METIIETILSGGFVEFSHGDERYLIQQESNKGCHYLSLWRTSPKAGCLCRAGFDVFDGVSAETLEELLDRQLPEGQTVRELLQSPEIIMKGN